jgi:hypothetical protein
MPMLLMDHAPRAAWMNAPIEEAILLQRPAANNAVRVVATGSKEDSAQQSKKRECESYAEGKPEKG